MWACSSELESLSQPYGATHCSTIQLTNCVTVDTTNSRTFIIPIDVANKGTDPISINRTSNAVSISNTYARTDGLSQHKPLCHTDDVAFDVSN